MDNTNPGGIVSEVFDLHGAVIRARIGLGTFLPGTAIFELAEGNANHYGPDSLRGQSAGDPTLAAAVQNLEASADFKKTHAEDAGFSLLHCAALLGQTTLENARKIDADKKGADRPLFAKIARSLMRCRGGSITEIEDKYGRIPLHLAAAYGNKEMVEVLLDPYGLSTEPWSDLNHQDEQGFTALHYAMEQEHHDVAIMLLCNRADPQNLDLESRNAFQMAPSLTSLQGLLKKAVDRVVEATEEASNSKPVPVLAIVQLMIEVTKRQEQEEYSSKVAALVNLAPGDYTTAVVSPAPAEYVGAAAVVSLAPAEYTAAVPKVMSPVHPAGKEDKEAPAAAPPEEAPPIEAGEEVGDSIKRIFKNLYDKTHCLDQNEEAQREHAGGAVLRPVALVASGEIRTLEDPEAVKKRVEELQENIRELWGYVQVAVESDCYKLTAIMLDLICKEYPRMLVEFSDWAPMVDLMCRFPDLFHTLLYKLQDMSVQDVVGFINSLRGYVVEANYDTSCLVYQELVEGLQKVNNRVVTALFENAHQDLLDDMARFPAFENFVMLIEDKQNDDADFASSDRERLLVMLRPTMEVVVDEGQSEWESGNGQSEPASDEGQSESESGNGQSEPASDEGQSESESGNGQSEPASGKGQSESESGNGQSEPASDEGQSEWESGNGQSERATHTLDVSRVLWAAVKVGKHTSAEATVRSITSWVKNRRSVFITGISTELLKELSSRFPLACAKLLSLVGRDTLEHLVTLKVDADLLQHKDQLVKCSSVRNHFTWRAMFMELLKTKHFSEHVVDALVDYGVPFECTYKAAFDGNATREDFTALVEEGFTGEEIRVLISAGVQLREVVDIIQECKQYKWEHPPDDVEQESTVDPMADLIRDMVRNRLSFGIVLALWNHRDRALADCDSQDYYSAARVQELLTKWRKGKKSGENWLLRPWDKKFIDTEFSHKYPLCTALKSAYDNKLKDTQVYIDERNEVAYLTRIRLRDQKRRVRKQRLVLSAFVCQPFLLHRWPVFFLMHLLRLFEHVWLFFRGVLDLLLLNIGDMRYSMLTHTHWLRITRMLLVFKWVSEVLFNFLEPMFQAFVSRRKCAPTVDARALVIPWKGKANIGGILTALVDADVPSRWFGLAAVKAVVTVQWQEYGQMMTLMSALTHLIFMALFGAFLLALRQAGEEEGGQMDKIRKRPEVMALLIVLGLMSSGGVAEEMSQIMRLRLRTWGNYLGNIMDLVSFALFFMLFGMVWASYRYDVILAIGALEMLLLFIRLVFFASMTDSMGSLVRMVVSIIKDMKHFFIMLGMLFGGFAIAFYVLLGPNDTPTHTNSYEKVAFKLFSVMLGDWSYEYLYDMIHDEDHEYNWYMSRLSVLLMSVYGILMQIVLVNLLIAIMNDTFDRIKETEEVEVLHNRARLIVDLESLLTEGMRDKMQKELLGDYLHVLVLSDEMFEKFTDTLETVEGEWKGRIRALAEIMKRELRDIRGLHERQDSQFHDIRSELDSMRQEMRHTAAATTAEILARLPQWPLKQPKELQKQKPPRPGKGGAANTP